MLNKTTSKYFITAKRMDEAFLKLLEKKDFAYITVKEICAKAKVNRSTFYLHYETLNDLLDESTEYMNHHFQEYMAHDSNSFVERISECSIEELYLITPEYLTPYLSYIKDHKRLFSTAMLNAQTLGLSNTYDRMFQHVFTPILDRFNVSKMDRDYIMSFYISGLIAIIKQWLKDDCNDDIAHVISIIQRCIKNTKQLSN